MMEVLDGEKSIPVQEGPPLGPGPIKTFYVLRRLSVITRSRETTHPPLSLDVATDSKRWVVAERSEKVKSTVMKGDSENVIETESRRRASWVDYVER